MKIKKNKLQLKQEELEKVIKKTNEKINELGNNTNDLYISLQNIHNAFNNIKNVPEEFKVKYEKVNAIRLNWKEQVNQIEKNYQKAEVKQLGNGTAVVGTGVAVATMGPTVAMGIATTFGVASTGTAISTLSGAAATNAALAWLGGGALTAGGSGMAAGKILLAMAGPIGWTIAGISLMTGGILFFKTKKNREKVEKIYIHISDRDIKTYELAIVELSERIKRIKNETLIINDAIIKIKKLNTDYNKLSVKEQYELGAYYNLMESSTMLLVNPILGLQPKVNNEDLEIFLVNVKDNEKKKIEKNKQMILYLSNLLFKIKLDEKEIKLLYKLYKKDNKFLENMEMDKKDFNLDYLLIVQKFLNFRYKFREY